MVSSRRPLMWVVGLALLVVYVGGAALVYAGIRFVLARPPDPVTAVLVIGATTLVGGYLSYRFGTQQLLAGLETREITPHDAPRFFRRVDDMVTQMAIDRPRVFVASLGAPNAFALGGVNSGVLVIDVSLFRFLSAEEREAIVAHELSHLENNDAFVQTLAYSAMRTLVGLFLLPLVPILMVLTGLARGLAWMRGRPHEWQRNPLLVVYAWLSLGVTVLAIAVTALIRAHSRRREYAADERAIEVTGKPLALARALRKIERATDRERGLLSTLYVSGDEDGILTRLLSTHPPMDDRIERILSKAETNEGYRIPIQ